MRYCNRAYTNLSVEAVYIYARMTPHQLPEIIWSCRICKLLRSPIVSYQELALLSSAVPQHVQSKGWHRIRKSAKFPALLELREMPTSKL
jgi:hypothetical protein